MIVTPRFVFLHLHKSGGTFVNEALLRFVPGARHVGYHLPRTLLPPELARRPAIGLIRNPWSFYVSWYAFQCASPRPNVLFRILSEDARLGFERTIARMVELGRDDELLDRVLAVLPSDYGQSGLNVPARVLAAIRGRAVGFYSFLFEHVFAPGDADALTIVRLEHLQDELTTALQRLGHPVDEDLLRFLREAPRRNTSAHPPYQTCFADSLRDLVAERDATLIRDYGYAFAS